jgi:hypothetical protein
MIDTSNVATEIRHLIASGAQEHELVAVVARKFPELTRSEFVAALQDATAAAEKAATRRH